MTEPTFAAGGTTANLTGTLVTPDGKPVPGAVVTISAPSAGTYKQTTDGAGHFSFLGVPIDTFNLSADVKGYSPLLITGITLTGGANLNIGSAKLPLKEIARASVVGGTSAFQPNTIPSTTISGAQLEAAGGKSANVSGQEILLSVPGFQTDSEGGLILQGSLQDQVHYQFDGVDFTDPGFNRNINNNFFNGIGTVQVVPGAGDPSQGNAGAGAVNEVARRGTYPASGLFDFEANTKPYGNQYQLSYGAATRSQNISDYFSFSAVRDAAQYGAFGTSAAYNNTLFAAQQINTNDFVNNFVVRFGKNNNQSLQVLYLNDYSRTIGNYGDNTIQYPSSDPGLYPFIGFTSGLTDPQNQSIIGFEQGQTSAIQNVPNQYTTNNQQTNFLKFEYDNQFNSTTNLALRFFSQNLYDVGFPSGATTQGPLSILRGEQTVGGSRVGTTFELNKQAGTKNFLTLSGNLTVDKPDFGTVEPYAGLLDGGTFDQDFLVPANTSAPISAANPCPVANGCYLYQETGKVMKVPDLVLQSAQTQHQYGLGIRDQIQVSNNVKADVGLRYDLINEGFGNNLFYADESTQPIPGSPSSYYIPNYGFVEEPHFLEPRLGISDKVSPRDSIAASYGRSIQLQGQGELASPESQSAYRAFSSIPINPNPIDQNGMPQSGGDVYIGASGLNTTNCFNNLPFAVGATATSKPSYNGKIGTTLQFGKPCANYGTLLYTLNDAFFPEVTAVQPGVFNNYDFTFSHLFRNGSALKLNPYYRQGSNVQVITANLIDINGTFMPGTLSSQSVGKSYTTGLDVQYTLPDRPSGFSGFVSLSYTNEFTNTPAGTDSPNTQDFEPLVTPQSLAAHDLYRAGFVSPFVARFGPVFKTKGGFRFNPVLSLDAGYPIGAGLTTPYFYGNGALNVPNTNLTNQFSPNGAPQYVDPANPGSIFKPYVAATRGNANTSSGGGELSKPQLTGDINMEYAIPNTRSTIGFSVLNFLGNEFGNGIISTGQALVGNQNYLPVTTGVAGPLTGQNPNHAAVPSEIPLTTPGTTPFSSYNTGLFAPPFFKVYYQVKL